MQRRLAAYPARALSGACHVSSLYVSVLAVVSCFAVCVFESSSGVCFCFVYPFWRLEPEVVWMCDGGPIL